MFKGINGLSAASMLRCSKKENPLQQQRSAVTPDASTGEKQMPTATSNSRAAGLIASFGKLATLGGYDTNTALRQLVGRHGPTQRFVSQSQKKDPDAVSAVLESYLDSLGHAMRNSRLMNHMTRELCDIEKKREHDPRDWQRSTTECGFTFTKGVVKLAVKGVFTKGEDGGLATVRVIDNTGEKPSELLFFSLPGKMYRMDTSPTGWDKLMLIDQHFEQVKQDARQDQVRSRQQRAGNLAASLGLRT
jgi:hypothetical protein